MPTRAVYGGTPAEFAIAQGASADILDELGAVVGSGAAALLPEVGQTFDVYRNDRETVADDLLAADGTTPITQITSVADFDERARFLEFYGEDDNVPETYWATPASGDLAGVVFYALHPHVEAVVAYVDGAVGRSSVQEHTDWSDTDPTNGQIPVFSTGSGVYVPTSAGSPATTPVVIVYNGTAWPARASVIGVAPFVWWIVPSAYVGAADPSDADGIDIIDRIPA